MYRKNVVDFARNPHAGNSREFHYFLLTFVVVGFARIPVGNGILANPTTRFFHDVFLKNFRCRLIHFNNAASLQTFRFAATRSGALHRRSLRPLRSTPPCIC